MIKLFCKFFLIFVLLNILTITGLIYTTQYINNLQAKQNSYILAHGLFHFMTNKLRQYPEQQWPKVISALKPRYANPLNIYTFNNVPLNKRQKVQLKKNIMVYTNSRGLYEPAAAYKRIDQSKYILKLDLQEPVVYTARRFSGWWFYLIMTELKKQPKSTWPAVIQYFHKTFNLPIKLIPLEKIKLPKQLNSKHIKQLLTKYHFIYYEKYNHTQSALKRIQDSNLVLKIGPILLPTINRYSMLILCSIGFFIFTCLILIWIYFLSRSLDKLILLAKYYSQGQFDKKVKLTHISPFKELLNHLETMGRQLNQLITSHKDLTNTVSHELRTPITRIRFATEILSHKSIPHEEAQMLTSINEDIKEMDHLIDNLLKFAQIDRLTQAMTFESSNLYTFIKKIVNEYKIKQNITIKFNCTNKGIKKAIAPLFFKIAIRNIIDNALKFYKQEIIITLNMTKNHCQIIIDDDGIGIPKESQQQIFQPFVQLQQTKQEDSDGYGFGLALTAKIIKQHNGSIKVTHSPLGGARFIINL